MTRSWIDKECNGWCVQGCVREYTYVQGVCREGVSECTHKGCVRDCVEGAQHAYPTHPLYTSTHCTHSLSHTSNLHT